jgi:pSer/pThr/pTyr-binding forkhead associated (FHA) protein
LDAPAVAPTPHPRGSPAPQARLSYTDERGAGVFAISKDLVKIGRGGSAHWVDLAVVTGPRVSREHCRIRRDASGRFFIQDVSTWGTFVNGAPVPKPAEGRPSAERELVDGASIRLADAVTLEFRIG